MSGPEDGIPVLMIHGNLATCRFVEHLMPAAPAGYRLVAPDMRGFGDTERVPIDSTRGLRDWADDAYALVRALGIERPVHLVGWSTGGAAIAAYAEDRPVASLTLVDSVSPYGFGGSRLDGSPIFSDWAGSGGGTGSPEFTQRLASGDRSDESPLSPRNVINSSYRAPTHREPRDREDGLVDEILKSETGEHGYPGDLTPSPNWPGVAPGVHGILNALSGKYCDWSTVVDIDPKPPALWTHGSVDVVVSDASAWDLGNLGKLGIVPGWPGDDAYPPQPMVTQIRPYLWRTPRRVRARNTARRITAPTKATMPSMIKLPTAIPARPASQPPRKPPRMPTTTSQTRPRPFPVTTLPARNPAIPPTTIQTINPMPV